jgi:hypothetical protein
MMHILVILCIWTRVVLVSISDLVDKIDETGCCDRLFGQVIVIGYLYRFGAWLMQLFMVQGLGTVWCMVDACWYMLEQVIGTGCLVQVDWYRFTIVYLTVIV